MSFHKHLKHLSQEFLLLSAIRQIVISAIDGACIATACLATFVLRFEFSLPPLYVRVLRQALLLWPLAKLVTFAVLRLYRRSWRHASAEDLTSLIVANILGSMVTVAAALSLRLPVPRSVWVSDLVLCFLLTGA